MVNHETWTLNSPTTMADIMGFLIGIAWTEVMVIFYFGGEWECHGDIIAVNFLMTSRMM